MIVLLPFGHTEVLDAQIWLVPFQNLVNVGGYAFLACEFEPFFGPVSIMFRFPTTFQLLGQSVIVLRLLARSPPILCNVCNVCMLALD
jgi:hypothetical protein